LRKVSSKKPHWLSGAPGIQWVSPAIDDFNSGAIPLLLLFNIADGDAG
jgi:hypothetical protein